MVQKVSLSAFHQLTPQCYDFLYYDESTESIRSEMVGCFHCRILGGLFLKSELFAYVAALHSNKNFKYHLC